MAWDFSTDPEYQKKLDWARQLVDEEIIPLELLIEDLTQAELNQLLEPFKQRVRERELWAPHLGPEDGGQGMGQVNLALLHETLGRCQLAPEVFGCQAPDSGNAELLAVGADEAQRERWLYPLIRGELRSCFSMTEPDIASSDPTELKTSCRREGDCWRIDGHKWFASNGSVSDFFIVMVVTDPDAPPHQRASMVVVPREAKGLRIVRDVPTMHHPSLPDEDSLMTRVGGHAEVLFEDCRVPLDHMIGKPGDGFLLAQKRLGGGRIHHAMRTIGQARRAFEMMCERAASRQSRGKPLGSMQMVQDMIAESWIRLECAYLLVMRGAWSMDRQGGQGSNTRLEIAAIKCEAPRMLLELLDRAIQIHGALGYSCDMPLEGMYRMNRSLRIADGADEVHKQTIARQVLKDVKPVDGWPSEHVPTRLAEAHAKFDALIKNLRQAA